MAVKPDGTRAYVTNRGAGTVSVIDTATNTVTATIKVGTNPSDIAITPDGTLAFVTNTGSNSVTRIDTATNKVLWTVHRQWRLGHRDQPRRQVRLRHRRDGRQPQGDHPVLERRQNH